jgi:putative ATP-dependent endonuclease of OLD family
MHISKLALVNYRNFANTKLIFNKGVNTVIGENGSGKTNLFRAIRLLLDNNMLRSAYKLDETDFHRGLNSWQGHWIIISLEFVEISSDEAIQALFLHGTGAIAGGAIDRATYNLIFRPKKEIRLRLANLDDGDLSGLASIRQSITIEDYETVLTGKSEADFNSEMFYKSVVGDFENCIFSEEIEHPQIGAKVPVYLSLTNEVSFTFIQALRDVVAEFHNNRTNPLFKLLKSKSGEIAPAIMAPIVAKVQDLNSSIEALDDIQLVRANIRDTIKDAAGETYSPSSLSIKSDLSDEADKLFQSLRLFVGESDENYEGAIHELSLGGANLIYLTLKLLEFKYQKAHESIANFLLIEEPEAHIHTHIQKTLFDRIVYSDTQIIYSTHSTNISEVSKIQSVNILGKSGNNCDAYQPATGLSADEVGSVQRYLDAVRSNLLFAKSVVLVEGDAEEILIPMLFKKVVGLSLDELGISLINIRSTGFKNVALLFHDSRIKKRCSIITDLDTAFIDTTPVLGEGDVIARYKAQCLGSQQAGANRKNILDNFVNGNQWLSVFYARHTFEVDFILSGNANVIERLAPLIYSDPPTITLARRELNSGNIADYGKRVIRMAKQEGKGWFAILLSKNIDYNTVIPKYISDAIFFARQSLSKEIFFNIYSYRVSCALANALIPELVANAANVTLNQYRDGGFDLATLKARMMASLPGDQIHDILANLT